MGVGGRNDFCGQLVKYGMFISNLVIFVSTFPEFIRFIEPVNKLVLTPANIDRRCNCLCVGTHYARRPKFPQRAARHEPVLRSRLRSRHHFGAGVSAVFLRLLRGSAGDQVHALDGKF